jgi:hypothetical protein
MNKRWEDKKRYAIQVRMPDGKKQWMDHDGRLNPDVTKRYSYYYKHAADSALRAFKRMNSRIFWRGSYIGLPTPKLISV